MAGRSVAVGALEKYAHRSRPQTRTQRASTCAQGLGKFDVAAGDLRQETIAGSVAGARRVRNDAKA